MRTLAAIFAFGVLTMTSSASADEHKRIRDIGIRPGVMTPGPLNAVTDVEGVAIGHLTKIEGDSVRTGVTAILPHQGDLFFEKTRAAVFTGNGYGKATGFEQVRELGEIESPIILTNTLSVGAALTAVVRWTVEQPGHGDVRSVNVVVGETNDGTLNDIRGLHVTEADVRAAIAAARPGLVQEGAVGAGTGTIAFAFKGGIGTSSRRLPGADGGYTVGVLVQTNYGGLLTIDGVRVGEALGKIDRKRFRAARDARTGDGSVMIVVATDAPLDVRNLERVAKRALLGIARTGGIMENGSGDFVIAFSTANRIDTRKRRRTDAIETLRNDAMSLLFLATVEATEEAVYNSLAAAKTMTGRDGKTVEALPLDRVRALFK